MRDPIELTQAQRREVLRRYNEAHSHVTERWCPTPAILQEIVAIINRVREGDPVGTARRDPRTGTVAVRVGRYECPLIDCGGIHLEPSWAWVDGNGTQHHTHADDCISGREIATWPAIYRPGGDT